LKLEIWGLHARILAWIHKKTSVPNVLLKVCMDVLSVNLGFSRLLIYIYNYIYIDMPNLEWYLSEHFLIMVIHWLWISEITSAYAMVIWAPCARWAPKKHGHPAVQRGLGATSSRRQWWWVNRG
jgi:hypothetical protein